MTFFKTPHGFPALSSARFNFLYSLFTIAAYNITFILAAKQISGSWTGAALIAVCVLCGLNIVLALLFTKHLVKPLAIAFCIVNTAVLYFMTAYGVVIDKIMLMNVIQTDVYEVADLLNVKMFFYLTALGIIPSYLIYKTRITFLPFKKEAAAKVLQILFYTLIIVAVTAAAMPRDREVFNRNKHIKNALIPVNYIGAAISVAKIKWKYRKDRLQEISADAHMLPQSHNGKPNLIVVVIGESARDASFSLSGYQRPTNRPLEKFADELIYFDNFYSCGTATAISLPCIFSPYPRQKFEPESERRIENVLDILDHAGYKMLWRENNTDCKDNCNRIEQERFCHVKECPDEIMLTDFAAKVQSSDKPAVVVLHQRGSHGPLYSLRYPPEFEVYRPVCRKEFLHDCQTEELVNAYDNTIYYTSHMLAQTLELLKRLSDRYNTALFFTSDHGESLGENGVYLHSAPYDSAPDEQKHVPGMFWFSADYAADNNLDVECVRRLRSNYFSHDNVFHTLLGMSRVSSSYYNPELDILARCRR